MDYLLSRGLTGCITSLHDCKGCGTGGSEVRRRRAEIGNSRSSLISKPTAIKKITYKGTKPDAHQKHSAQVLTNKQFHTRTWGEQGVKYTTLNEGNGNQVCRKTRQNKWKMKSDRRWLEDRWRRTPAEQGEESTSVEVVTMTYSLDRHYTQKKLHDTPKVCRPQIDPSPKIAQQTRWEIHLNW